MSEAKKEREGKPDLSLIPYCVEAELARAMMNGEQKYGRYNYCLGHDNVELVAAAKRHLGKYLSGETYDSDSGVHHLAHAMANCLMIIHQEHLGTSRDKRHLPEVATDSELFDALNASLESMAEYLEKRSSERYYEIRARSSFDGDVITLEACPDITFAQNRLRHYEKEWPTFTLFIEEVEGGHSENP